jgi:hypothetical protein
MGDVLSFARPVEEVIHRSGAAHCLHCRHEWVAVAPVGIVYVECPECHCDKGVFTGVTLPPVGTEHFVCGCGNGLFSVTRDYVLCANCGSWKYFSEL